MGGEASLRSDGLSGGVYFGRGILLVLAFADAVDFVVDGGTVMIAILTGASDRPLDVRRMPRTNASDFS